MPITEANKKNALVVTVDPSKMVDADGKPINLSNTRAVKRWLLGTYQGREVKVNDDGQVVRFTRGGLESGLKRRGAEWRRAYADLDCIVENSIYYSYTPGDALHPHIDKQKTYYGAVNISGQQYAVRLKVDVPKEVDIGLYKDLAVTKIESPSLYIGGSLENNRTYQPEGEKTTVPVPDIVRAFERTTNKINDSAPKVNTQDKIFPAG